MFSNASLILLNYTTFILQWLLPNRFIVNIVYIYSHNPYVRPIIKWNIFSRMKRAAFASNIVNVSVAMFQQFINVCSVFFTKKKRQKNGICTKCLLISKKYIYVTTGVSPVKDCKRKKDFIFQLMYSDVSWCSRSCG